MLFSMLPVNAFAADVDESAIAESTPVTEAPQAAEDTVSTEAPVSESTTAPTVTTEAPAEEIIASTEAPEAPAGTTEASEEAADPVPTETEAQAPAQTEPQETEAEETLTVTEFTLFPDMELPSDEELFAVYAEQQFYGTGISLLGTAAGEALEGNIKKSYDALVPIIREIASGERDCSAIAIGYALSSDYPIDAAADLTGTDFTKTELDALLYALLADLPYDLYWFDKTSTGGLGVKIITSTAGKMCLVFYFSVSADYSLDSTTNTCDLDTGKTGAAAAAAANAKSIAETHADKSDYDKLLAYKDEICALTSYNTSAASSSYSGEYGDPWQMIHVFDGDDSTKVVCEGYSKAFQYLCDLSEFDADITCYSVVGTLNGGNHMWNIVTIDGSSYLVDVTNSDGSYAGSSGGMFLAGGTPNSSGVYTFCSCKFAYSTETKTRWGTGEGSILILATEDYDPDLTAETPETGSSSAMTGEELLAALETVSNQYWLTQAVVITSDIEIPSGKYVMMNSDAGITVADGGTLTIALSAGISVFNGAPFTVEKGGTLIINGQLAIGGGTTVTIEEGGTLENNQRIDISYGTLAISGTYTTSVTYAGVYQDIYSTVTGIEPSDIDLLTRAYTEEELIDSLQVREGYKSQTTIAQTFADSDSDGINDPLTLTQNVTIPEGITLQIGDYLSDMLVVGAGVELVNNGTIDVLSNQYLKVEEGGTLTNNGTITNSGEIQAYGTVTNNGTLEGNAAVNPDLMTEAEFLLAMSYGVSSYTLTKKVEIASDFTIPEGVALTVEGEKASITVLSGGSLTLPSGSNLGVNVGSLTVEEGGSLILNSAMAMGTNGTVTIAGTLENNSQLDVYTGTLTVTGSYTAAEGAVLQQDIGGTVTGIDKSIIDLTALVCTEEALIDALTLREGYASQTVKVVNADVDGDGAFDTPTLTQNVTVPEGVTLQIGNGISYYTLIVSAGFQLINNGTIHVLFGQFLKVLEGAELINNGHIINDGNIHTYGTYTNNGTFEGNAARHPDYMTEEEFLAGMEADTLYLADKGLIVTSDLVISADHRAVFSLDRKLTIAAGGSLTIEEGATLDIMDVLLTIEPGGELINNGLLRFYTNYQPSISGTLENNGTIDLNYGKLVIADDGTYIHGENAIVRKDVSSTVTGVDHSLVDIVTLANSESRLNSALKLRSGYKSQTAQLTGPVELTADLTVPAGVKLEFVTGTTAPSLTVPDSITLTNNGTVTLDSSSTLTIAEGGTLKNCGCLENGGTLVNNGLISLGAAVEGFYSSLYSYGTYTHGENAAIETTLSHGYPLYCDLVPFEEQTLVYSGNDATSVNQTLSFTGWDYRQIRVDITGDLELNSMVIPENATVNIAAAVTLPEGLEVANYGSICVQEGGILNVDGGLSNYHPNGALTVASGASANVDGTLHNGTVTTVYGTMVINGNLDGYVPVVAEGGSLSGTGLPSPQDIFEDLLEGAAAGNYEAKLASSLTLTDDVTVDCVLIIPEGVTLTVPSGVTLTVNRVISIQGGTLTVKRGGTLVNSNVISNNGGTLTIASGATYTKAREYTAVNNYYANGAVSTVSGIPVAEQTLCVAAQSEAEIQAVLDLCRTEDYQGPNINIMQDLTLNDNLTLPADAFLVVGSGSTATLNGILTAEEGASIEVLSGSTLELGIESYNRGMIHVIGTLKLGDYCQIFNEGGSLGIDGTIEFGTAAIVNNVAVNGMVGGVSGVAEEKLYLAAWPETMADVHALVDTYNAGGYKSGTIYIEEDFVIDEDVTIPAGVLVHVITFSETEEAAAAASVLTASTNAAYGTGSGAALTIAEGVTVTVEGYITVQENNTLVNNGCLTVYGRTTVKDGASFTNNSVVQCEASGTVNVMGTYEGEGQVCTVYDNTGACGTISGVSAKEVLLLNYTCDSEENLQQTLAYGQAQGYGSVIVNLFSDLTISGQLTIPENATVNLISSEAEDGTTVTPTLTIGADAAVTNNGTLQATGDTSIVIDGDWEGELPSGNVSGEYFRISQTEFEELLASGAEEIWLNQAVNLDTSMAIDVYLHIGEYGSIYAPENVTLTVNGGIWIDGGKLIVEEVLVNNSTIAITAGHVIVNGEYRESAGAEFHNVNFDDGYYSNPAEVSGVDPSYQLLVYNHSDEEVLLDYLAELSAGYGSGRIHVSGDLVLTNDITIPENAEVIIRNDGAGPAALTVYNGVTLTNEGTISIGFEGCLNVCGTYEGILPNLNDMTAEFNCDLGKISFTQYDLEAQLAAAAETGEAVVLSAPVLLDHDLEIPGGVRLEITKGGSITIPGGKTLYNYGETDIRLWGQIVAESGAMVNEGIVTVHDMGVLDMTNGTYEQSEWAQLYNMHRSEGGDSIFTAEVLGLSYQFVTMIIEGWEENYLRSMMTFAENMGVKALNIGIVGDLTLSSDLTIPEYASAAIDNGAAVTVPSGKTLYNNGRIEIPYGILIVEEGGALVGSAPAITDWSGAYENANGYDEEDLRADIAAGKEIFLNSSITLTDDLTIPENVVITISSGGELLIPEGLTLTNNGQIWTQLFGAVRSTGGTLVNNALTYNSNWGVTDMASGEYVHGGAAKLYNVHYCSDPTNPDNRTGTSVEGIYPGYMTVVAKGCSEDLIREMMEYCENITTDGNYPELQINVTDGELVLQNSLTIPEYALMTIENKGGGLGSVTIPEGVTLYNIGGIDICGEGELTVLDGGTLDNTGSSYGIQIGWAGTMVVEEGGTLLGSHPFCCDTGSEYVNHNTYDQAYLEGLISDAQANGTAAVLSVPVRLDGILEIPEDVVLLITGRENFLTIPSGTRLVNRGQIMCHMFGGILGEGGELYNFGDIHALNWGTVDMTAEDGAYVSYGGTVHNHHWACSDGTEAHATVMGFYPTDVTVHTEGDVDHILHEMIRFINSVADGGSASPLTSSITGDMVLSGEMDWPWYGTMTIPEGVTVTVPKGVTLYNSGLIEVYGQLIVEGTLVNDGRVTTDDGSKISGNVDFPIIVPGAELTDFTVQADTWTISPESTVNLWVASTPEHADIAGYRYVVANGNAGFGYYWDDELGDIALLTEIVTDNTGKASLMIGAEFDPETGYPIVGEDVTVEVTPVIYDEYGSEVADETMTQAITLDMVNLAGTIVIPNVEKPDFYEAGNAGFYVGTEVIAMGWLMNVETREFLSEDVSLSASCSSEDVIITDNADGTITISASDKLNETAYVEITAVPGEGTAAAPGTITIVLRPKATKVDITINGEIRTGETITYDLNRTAYTDQDGSEIKQRWLELDLLTDPAGALPEFVSYTYDINWNMIPLLTWTSSKEAVATVDENGLVTFTGTPGTVKITATANYGSKQTASITIKAAELVQEIAPASTAVTELIGGKSATYTVVDGNGNAVKSSAVKWFLCDEDGNAIGSYPYASISAKGKLTTKAVQDIYQVYLMAQVIGDEQSAMLDAPVEVTLYPAVTNVDIVSGILGSVMDGGKYSLDISYGIYPVYAQVYPYDAGIKSIEWKSSKPAVADVFEEDGICYIQPLSKGTTKITLTVTALDGKKTTATFSLTCGNFVSNVALTVPETIYGGDKITLGAEVLDEIVDNDTINWTLVYAEDKSYASLTAAGKLTAKKVSNPVTVTVCAYSKDGWWVSEAIEIRIDPKPVTVNGETMDALVIWDALTGEFLTKTSQTIIPGSALELAVNADSVTWTSSKPAVANVDANGVVTAIKDGTTTITAAADGRTATFTLKVGKLSTGVQISSKTGAFVVASGKSLNLAATVVYTDGSSNSKVTWSVSDASAAKISSGGKLTAAKNLSEPTWVTVYADAKDGSAYSYQEVQIVPLATGLEIFGPFNAGSSYDVDISNTTQKWDMTTRGTTFYLRADVFSGDSMQDVTWKSSSTKVASIDQNGKVTCLKSGTVTITATAKDGSGKKASFKLTVYKTMAELELPETAFIGGGKTLTLTKLDGYYVDPLATNKTLNWTMTDENGSAVPKTVATLSSKGVLKTKAVTAPVVLLIRAEAADGSGLSAQCAVTIYPVISGVNLCDYDTGKSISKQTIDLHANLDYRFRAVSTNGDDVTTADKGSHAAQTWTVTSAKPAIAECEVLDDGTIVVKPVWKDGSYTTGKVKITVKANDGSGKSAYFTVNITAAEK